MSIVDIAEKHLVLAISRVILGVILLGISLISVLPSLLLTFFIAGFSDPQSDQEAISTVFQLFFFITGPIALASILLWAIPGFAILGIKKLPNFVWGIWVLALCLNLIIFTPIGKLILPR